MDDIFDITEFKDRIRFILFHFCGWFFYLTIHKWGFNNIYSIVYYVLAYILIFIVFSCIHNYRYERDKLKILNSNLIEYSFKEREYLISEERTRISQELHDSIGHSLMALSMNIRYLKALEDKDKIKNEVYEIDKLVKESIQTLRSTVYNLKELDEKIDLKEEIKRISKKFNDLGIVTIKFNCENYISFLSNKIENILLTTIKESITNSLKHGNPSIIDISIEIIDDRLQLKIKDNGEGCKYIKKSNGLNGITERVKNIKGEVVFFSSINGGFTIEVLIPGGALND
jgi:signal transduction histidine kinase